MGCFSSLGANFGFPWFMLLFPVLFFGMMFFFCRTMTPIGYMGCWNRHERRDISSELDSLRKEVETLKRNNKDVAD